MKGHTYSKRTAAPSDWFMPEVAHISAARRAVIGYAPGSGPYFSKAERRAAIAHNRRYSMRGDEISGCTAMGKRLGGRSGLAPQ